MLTIDESQSANATESLSDAVVHLDCLDVAGWQQFVESHPASMVFHHRRWIEMIQRHYALHSYFPCLISDGEVLAAIPFLECHSLLGVRKFLSLPYSDYLPVLSRRSDAALALVQALVREHPTCGAMSLRTDTTLAGLPSTSEVVRHEVRPMPALDSLWKTFKPSIQRNIRKAERAGLKFAKRTDHEAMDTFYRLHVLTRQKLGVPVQPKSFFDRMQREIIETELGFVGLVNSSEKTVAAAVYLTFNRTVTYKYSASDPAALADRPNDLLVFGGLQFAAEEGYDAFDFGISNRHQDGLRRFKSQWGAHEIDVHSVQMVGDVRKSAEESRMLKLGGVVIRNSPAFVCRGLGEVFYRFAN